MRTKSRRDKDAGVDFLTEKRKHAVTLSVSRNRGSPPEVIPVPEVIASNAERNRLFVSSMNSSDMPNNESCGLEGEVDDSETEISRLARERAR